MTNRKTKEDLLQEVKSLTHQLAKVTAEKNEAERKLKQLQEVSLHATVASERMLSELKRHLNYFNTGEEHRE